MSEKTKYSESELQEFKDLIDQKLQEAKKDLEMFNKQISDEDNNGTDDTSRRFLIMEEQEGPLSKDTLTALAKKQREYIVKLENSLRRISNGVYGICRSTGKLIPKERLRAVPHATLSVEAKEAQAALA